MAPEDDLPSAKELFGNLDVDGTAYDVRLPNPLGGELGVSPYPQL